MNLTELKQKYINACSFSDIDTIVYMINEEEKIIKTEKVIIKCLNQACEIGNVTIVKLLVQHINTTDPYNIYYTRYINNKTIDYAFEGGNHEIICMILDILRRYNSNIIEQLLKGLYGACRGGNLEIFLTYKNKLEKLDSKIVDSIFINTCLGEACYSGNLDLVQLIISYGANNWNDGLAKACLGCHLEIIKFMLLKGASVNWLNKNISLYYICKNNDVDIVEFFMENYNYKSESGLCDACRSGNMKIVELMTKKHTYDWNQCLEDACSGGNIEIVNFMIKKGATRWNSGLYGACINRHLNFVKLMLQYGANNLKHCLFCVSNQSGDYFEVVELLLAHCRNMTHMLNLNQYLENACYYGNLEIVKTLIKNGDECWNRAGFMNEGLYLVCCGDNTLLEGEYIELVKLLLKHGANNFNECIRKTENIYIHSLLTIAKNERE